MSKLPPSLIEFQGHHVCVVGTPKRSWQSVLNIFHWQRKKESRRRFMNACRGKDMHRMEEFFPYVDGLNWLHPPKIGTPNILTSPLHTLCSQPFSYLSSKIAEHEYNTLKWVLDHGADPNFPDKNGNTPLHFAVKHCPDAMALLMAYGGDPMIENHNQLCAYALADEWGRLRILEIQQHPLFTIPKDKEALEECIPQAKPSTPKSCKSRL